MIPEEGKFYKRSDLVNYVFRHIGRSVVGKYVMEWVVEKRSNHPAMYSVEQFNRFTWTECTEQEFVDQL